MTELWRLTPEFFVLGGALLALFIGLVTSDKSAAARSGAIFAIAGALAAGVVGQGGTLFGGMLAFDATSVFARIAIPALAAVWLLWVSGRGTGPERSAEAAALALFSALGGMLMVSARDLIVLYIALELSTMPAYVLIGYRRGHAEGLEGALKYFLLSMLTSLVLLYGLSFVYGLAGSTAYADLALREGGPLGQVAFVFVLVGVFGIV